MNKYEQVVRNHAPQDSVIYELLRKEIQSTRLIIADILLDNILSAGSALKQLEAREAYFLVLYNDKAELFLIKRNLEVSRQDVTQFVQKFAGKKYFDMDGYRYKLFRRLKK